jgi:hypothetical protein
MEGSVRTSHRSRNFCVGVFGLDEKIRQDAALAILAYDWGRPVERKMVAQSGLRDMKELLARVDDSEVIPESLQKAADCTEVTLALPPHDN